MAIDALDRKILAIIDKDARLAESEIARRTGTSKQVVRYRLSRMQNQGVIENYYTMLDVGRLGFDSYYLFVQLTGLNSTSERELYAQIESLPCVAWLITGVGRWDAVILVCARNISQFNAILTRVKEILGPHLHELTFTTLIQAEHISYKFLNPLPAQSLKTTPKHASVTLDKTDTALLRLIRQSARVPLTEVATKMSCPFHTVHYRLKQLIKQNLIQGFRPKLNVQKLGMQWHLLLISFHAVPASRLSAFLEYCKTNKNVYYLTNTVGKYNVLLDVHVEATQEFREFLFGLKDLFGDVILLYESLVVFEERLITYVPEIVLEEGMYKPG
jgi:Lrp/AsnC family transcriptional regulator, leucine-responsive regulatory protein